MRQHAGLARTIAVGIVIALAGCGGGSTGDPGRDAGASSDANAVDARSAGDARADARDADATAPDCTPGACDDADPCTRDCATAGGCTHSDLGDQDGDGARCADDCNDLDPRVFPAAAEACDSLDNDCDGMFDEGLDGTREWAVDCDLDGSLAAGTERRLSCTPPPDPPEPCPTGEWIESDGLPEDDCNDAHRDVYAGQTRFFGMGIDGPTTGFDYDCDGMEERQYPPESDRMCFCTPDGACEGTAWIDDPPCGATAMLFDCDGSGCLTPRTTCETTVRCR